jgi:hypothetical protein
MCEGSAIGLFRNEFLKNAYDMFLSRGCRLNLHLGQDGPMFSVVAEERTFLLHRLLFELVRRREVKQNVLRIDRTRIG